MTPASPPGPASRCVSKATGGTGTTADAADGDEVWTAGDVVSAVAGSRATGDRMERN